VTRRTETTQKAWGVKASWHKTAKPIGLTLKVNGAFVHAKFALLPGEICQATTASAHKLARLVYFVLTRGQAFVEAGQDKYEERYPQRVAQNLTKRAQQLGFQLTPQETSSA
jgi:hypothetical protein